MKKGFPWAKYQAKKSILTPNMSHQLDCQHHIPARAEISTLTPGRNMTERDVHYISNMYRKERHTD